MGGLFGGFIKFSFLIISSWFVYFKDDYCNFYKDMYWIFCWTNYKYFSDTVLRLKFLAPLIFYYNYFTVLYKRIFFMIKLFLRLISRNVSSEWMRAAMIRCWQVSNVWTQKNAHVLNLPLELVRTRDAMRCDANLLALYKFKIVKVN